MSSLQLIEDRDELSPTEIQVAEVHAMQRACLRLFEHWRLTDEQACILLGNIAKRTYQRWKNGELGRVNVDLSTRLSNLMGIHKALRLLFTDPKRGYEWIHRANTTFLNKTALEIMLGGHITDLMRIRRYLDAQRGD